MTGKISSAAPASQTESPGRPAGPAGVWGKLCVLLEMIKFEHTLFALPFALMATLLAAGGVPELRVLLWILAAMVGARSAAMAFNRLADQRYDALNPRTAGRALPAGQLTPAQVWVFVVCTVLLFVLAAWMLNPLAGALSPVALAIVLGYSYTKRFTPFCHLVLGLALGIAPSAAWIAVRGSLGWPAMLLSAAVLLWAGGFDILYSCQDVEFDRQQGLHSIPVRIGIPAALRVSRAMHAGVVLLLLLLPSVAPLGGVYLAGVAVVTALLAYEHSLVRADDLSRVNAAFFTVNGFVSISLFVFTALDVFLRRK